MDDASIIEFSGRDAVSDPLTGVLRKGARALLQSAVEADLDACLRHFSGYRTPEGRAGVGRNGHHPERAVQTGIGPVQVKIPKVRPKTGEPVTSGPRSSRPMFARRNPSRRHCPGSISRGSLPARWVRR